MKFNPHPYQQRAIDFVIDKPNCALLLDMGLGKSVITLTAIAMLRDYLEVEKVLVVAPKKVAETTWSDEASKWEHTRHLRVSRVLGTEKQCVSALQSKADIYVISRDSFVWLVKHYKAKLPFDMCVLDELTSFKSSTSKRFKAFRLVRSQFTRIVGLTGTPAPNGYEDLWGQFFCIDGGERLGKYKTRYIEAYFSYRMTAQMYRIGTKLRPGSMEAINERISDICISMKAEDYLSLPDITFIPYPVQLPEALMRQYHQFQRDQLMTLCDGSGSSREITAANAAGLMNKLLQFCNGAVYCDERDVQRIHGEKLNALTEIVEAAQSPVLVFYQFQHDITRITEALKGYKVEQYEDGETLKRWNAGKIDVLLAHPASTAYGLNMQQGGHVICWFGTGYNAELYEQANARLHRQGQKHNVRVYQLYVPGTFDEKAIEALNGKITIQDSLMNAIKELHQ